jgi:energy-coupling factor transporter ATP-binding protein EcfA2
MLPGGLRHILAIACVFARNPKLLLLDEPFAGLDDYHSAQLYSRIVNARQEGATIIIAEHRTRSIKGSLVSRVIEVREGGLVELAGAM